MSGEKTSFEEANGVATGVTGRIGCWNADSEARLCNAMLTVGKWVVSEAGVLLGHIKAAVTLDDGSGITFNLTDMSNGVEKHGTLPPQDKVNFTFMSAVLDVDEHELHHVMYHAVDDSGLLYEIDEPECHCHDHEHHHDHGECGCGHEHGHEHHHEHGKKIIVNNYYGDYYACCCECCKDDDECCCGHDHGHEHHHHHDHDEECHCHKHEHEHHHDHGQCCKTEHVHTESGTVIVNNYYGDFHRCKCKCCEDDDDDDECCCGHDHGHEHHHHHDHDEECHCHEHEHDHHDHDHDECCGHCHD